MLPYFFQKEIPDNSGHLELEESTSKHCIQVLRMKEGEKLLLTNGSGTKIQAKIISANKKKCIVELLNIEKVAPRERKLNLGICFTKNRNRNEWLLEKATELGVDRIFPIIAKRSEREKFNVERNQQILISAMLQSQQCHLPELAESQKLDHFLENSSSLSSQQFIAHCEDDQQKRPLLDRLEKDQDLLILIGPEGDFSPSEIQSCLDNQFIPVTLGPNRLRTETAALFACSIFNAFHYD